MFKLGLTFAAAAVITFLCNGAVAGREARLNSSFELAATNLNFKSSEQQDALLKIFYCAGYLDPHKLWTDLNRIESIKDHALEAFKLIYPVLVKANANQQDAIKLFNPKILRAKLFEGLNEQEAGDLLLYISQHAFNRKLGQERNKMKAQDWMTRYEGEYIKAAKVLGLIDRIKPSYTQYDAGWIAGSSRMRVLARVADYANTLLKPIVINGDTSVLAGKRELWAEIDGISPDVLKKLTDAAQKNINIDSVNTKLPISNKDVVLEEGKQYMKALAIQNNIALNPQNPFIMHLTKAECLPGREPGRWYANYADGEEGRLTESMMAYDVLKSIANTRKVNIVDTKSGAAGIRPDTASTASTAIDAAQRLVAEIKVGAYGSQKKFIILFESNQPYIERQALATQAAADEVFEKSGLKSKGYKIIIDGVGFACKQDVARVHSELGALVAEKMKAAMMEGSIPKHDLKQLLFQSRDSDSPVPDFPDVSAWHHMPVDLSGAEVQVAYP